MTPVCLNGNSFLSKNMSPDCVKTVLKTLIIQWYIQLYRKLPSDGPIVSYSPHIQVRKWSIWLPISTHFLVLTRGEFTVLVSYILVEMMVWGEFYWCRWVHTMAAIMARYHRYDSGLLTHIHTIIQYTHIRICT